MDINKRCISRRYRITITVSPLCLFGAAICACVCYTTSTFVYLSLRSEEDYRRNQFDGSDLQGSTAAASTTTRRYYLDDSTGGNTNRAVVDRGILSNKPIEFFRKLQQKIDLDDDRERCQRYGFSYDGDNASGRPKKHRRIFYGALLASESWELLEIIAAEAYGIFTGMVFVESNRTQNFSPRPFARLNDAETFRRLFGAEKVQVRPYVNEDASLKDLYREHAQRQEILMGWKDLGMTRDDVGFLCDADETLTRDFYRAVQVCRTVPHLDHEKNGCHNLRTGIRGVSQVYESSPECIVSERKWVHPNLLHGHCIEEIGNATVHPKVPRNGYRRQPGYGGDFNWSLVTNDRYSLFNGADLRRFVGQPVAMRPRFTNDFGVYTGYHFHNFFTGSKGIRFKYRTYGHEIKSASTMRLEEFGHDLALMYRCARNASDNVDLDRWRRVPGGFRALKPYRPIYFEDDDYRRRRHESILRMVLEDDKIYEDRRKRQQQHQQQRRKHNAPRLVNQ